MSHCNYKRQMYLVEKINVFKKIVTDDASVNAV